MSTAVTSLNPGPDGFLACGEYVDWRHPLILSRARELAARSESPLETARRCFRFVRDEIRHSWDYRLNPVTCRASEVLEHGTGYCYAKSHLLAALLRANGIPAGLAYQRLSRDDSGPPFCLHGLNSVWLSESGWYRVDARGNKPGINARFAPPVEHLAFPAVGDGEADLPGLFVEPLPQVIHTLTTCVTFLDVYENLPDLAEEFCGEKFRLTV